MKDRIKVIADRFEAYSIRERALVSVAVLVVMFLVWDTMFLTKEELRQKQIITEMQKMNQEIETLNFEVANITSSMKSNEIRQMQLRVEELQVILSDLDEQKKSLTLEFIKPEQMPTVLRDVLSSEGKLVLRNLESLGAEPLFPNIDKDIENNEESKPEIFKHGMKIVFDGDFYSTVKFIKKLESMPWRFYWDKVEYQVLKYPNARVAITLHTLSLEKRWIGV